MRIRLRTTLIGALVVGVSAALLLVSRSPGAGAQATASIRLAHMVPGAPAVDVYVNGQRAFGGLAFKQATEYAAVPAGQPNIRMARAGDPQAVVAEAMLSVQGGRQYTAIATLVSGQIVPLVLTDDNTPPAAGNAHVRFVHASPDAPAVDIAARGGGVLFSNVSYRNVGQYRAVPTGTYTLEVRPAGQSTVALTVPNVELKDGQVLTIIGAGQLADNSFSAVPVLYTAAGATETAAPGGAPRSGVGQIADQAFSSTSWLILAAFAALAGAAVLTILRPRVIAAADSNRISARLSTAVRSGPATNTVAPFAIAPADMASSQPADLSQTIRASVEEALCRLALSHSAAPLPADFVPPLPPDRPLTAATNRSAGLAETIAVALGRWASGSGGRPARGRRGGERR